MRIRDAVAGDARAIARVQVDSWRAAYVGLMPADVLAGLSVAESTAQRERSIAAGHPTLVLETPEIVGFAVFGADPEEEACGRLYALYLTPQRWGGGHGRLLHDAAVARLDETYPRSYLWVLDGNERAMRFYRAAGWRPDGATTVDETLVGAPLVEHRWVR